MPLNILTVYQINFFSFFFIPALKNGLCCIHFTLTQSLHQKTETNLFYYLNLKRKKITLMSAIQEIKIFQFISDIQVKPIWYNVLLLKKATEIKIIFLCLVVKAIFMKISLTYITKLAINSVQIIFTLLFYYKRSRYWNGNRYKEKQWITDWCWSWSFLSGTKSKSGDKN